MQKLTFTSPPPSLTRLYGLVVVLLSVNCPIAVPDAVKLLTDCVEPAVNEIAHAPVAVCVLVMLVKALLPVMVNAPAPPWFKVGQVRPPPAKVLAVAPVIEMVAVPVIVAFVDVANVQADAPVPATVHVPDPSARVRTLELVDITLPRLTL